MTSRFLILLALTGYMYSVSVTFGRPVSSYTGEELLEKSQVIVAVRSAEFELLRKGDTDWLVLRPDALKAFKGAIPASEIRIKSKDPGQMTPGKFAFPAGRIWLLLFLRELGGGRYEFAVDSLGQGQIGVPSGIDPRDNAGMDDFFVAMAYSFARTPGARLEEVFLLLAGLPSDKARTALSDLSRSNNVQVASTAILARIRGHDQAVFKEAAALLQRDGLEPDVRRRLEVFLNDFEEPTGSSAL